jgi:membrane-associated protease RseP (regulator of RpoE activity)
MSVPLFPATLATVLFAGLNAQVHAQETTRESKVRIEVVTTENGETKRMTKEFDAADEMAIEDALREMGVMEHFSFQGGEGELRIDIRDLVDGWGDPDHVRSWAHSLPPGTGGAHAWLGVSTASMSDAGGTKQEGARVQHVAEASPAAGLGLKEGDVIIMVDDVPIKGPGTLAGVVRDHAPGDKAELTWLRDGRRMSGTVTLAERREEKRHWAFSRPEGRGIGSHGPGAKRAFLGVTPAEEQGDSKGATIGTVEEGSAGATMGLKPGDIVRKVNDTEVADFAALAAVISTMSPGDAVTLTVERDGKAMSLSGNLGERKKDMTWREFHFDGLPPGTKEDLRRELDELRRDIEHMREELRREGGMPDRIRREMRITIQGRPLEQADKDLLTRKGVTGLDNELELDDLRCYPNPSQGFFRVHFDVPESSDLLVTVYDTAGEKVHDERLSGFKGRYERTLDLSGKPAGAYYLVIAQGGRTAARKLVKQ